MRICNTDTGNDCEWVVVSKPTPVAALVFHVCTSQAAGFQTLPMATEFTIPWWVKVVPCNCCTCHDQINLIIH